MAARKNPKCPKKPSPENILLLGKKINNLLVLEFAQSITKARGRHYLCLCDCGAKLIRIASYLKIGSFKNCINCRIKIDGSNYAINDTSFMINKKFGTWTVLEYMGKTREHNYICVCSCGIRSIIPGSLLRGGHSIGCRKCGSNKTKTHGMSNSKTYMIWEQIKGRCLRSAHKDYQYYGARGINICDRWLKFSNFLEDMGEKPEGLQIDRIDNNEGYSKENCRWATASENCSNRRTSNKYKNY